MKKAKILFFLLPIILLTGCYNYREINDLAITSAIGIDKTEDGYEIIIQVVNTQKQGSESTSSGDQPKFVIYKSKGKTLQEALRNVVIESPKRLYVNHLSLLIISENIAKEGLNDVLDIFARDSEFRKQFIVLISKDNNPDEILSTLTALTTLNSKNIKDSILTDSKYLGKSAIINFEDLLSNHLNDKKEILIPSVVMKGNDKTNDKDDNIKESEPSSRLILSDLGIFKNGKLIGYLKDQDSINISILQNKVNNTIYAYECSDNNFATIEITSTKTKIETSNQKPEIKISISQKATINEINCDIDLQNEKEIKSLESKIEKAMENSISKTLEKLNNFDSDVIGFTDLIYKNHPHYYKKLNSKYGDELFKNIKFKVNIDLGLYAKGNILKEI